MELAFSRQVWGSTQILNFTKILPFGAELFHADKRTDMTEVTVIFRISVNAPTNNDSILCHVINDASREKLALQNHCADLAQVTSVFELIILSRVFSINFLHLYAILIHLLTMKQLWTREMHTQNIACQKGGKKPN
jgi:hypothetical protein